MGNLFKSALIILSALPGLIEAAKPIVKVVKGKKKSPADTQQ